jgi:enterochelin esterase-like enzyme
MRLLSRLAALVLAVSVLAFPAPADDPVKKSDPLADGDYKIAPPYAQSPDLKAKPGVPKGKRFNFTMKSEDSKTFPGIKGAYKRNVSVYVPSQYVPGTEAPFILTHDAMASGQLSTLLDNYIAEKKLPVMIGIFVPSGGGDSKGSERGLEYDTVSGKYAEYIEQELLPLVEKTANVKLTKNPDGRATMGCSSGGAAAFSMAWWHPDLYHRVISYSGTFVNQQSPLNPQTPHGAWEYHENLIAKSEVKPLRVWLEVGEKDIGAKADEKGLHNWPMANERMAAALKAKGYHYRYVWAADAGHCDGRVQNQTLPEAMLYVWQGYPVK